MSTEVKIPSSQDPLDMGEKHQLRDWIEYIEIQKESNMELYCFVFQIIPTLLAIVQKIPLVKECLKVREQLSEALKTTWKSFGTCQVHFTLNNCVCLQEMIMSRSWSKLCWCMDLE